MSSLRLGLACLACLAPAAHGQTYTGTPAAGERQAIQGWNMSYSIPTGWQISPQSVGRVTVLASNTHAGAIFVAPGLYSNFNEVAADVTKFYQALGHQPYPVEQPAEATIAGFQAMTALFMSQDQMGQVVQSRGVSLITPHRTGFVVIGIVLVARALLCRLHGQVAVIDDHVAARPHGAPQPTDAAVEAAKNSQAGVDDHIEIAALGKRLPQVLHFEAAELFHPGCSGAPASFADEGLAQVDAGHQKAELRGETHCHGSLAAPEVQSPGGPGWKNQWPQQVGDGLGIAAQSPGVGQQLGKHRQQLGRRLQRIGDFPVGFVGLIHLVQG